MAQENKTEKATPYRRKKLREEGNVAKSVEIASALTVLLGSIALFYAGYSIFTETVNLLSFVSGNPSMEFHSLLSYINERVPKLLLPFFILTVITVIAVHIGQFGFIFTLKPLEPKWDRLNPFQGIKRIFSLTLLFELVKNSFKVIVLLGIVYLTLKQDINTLINTISVSPAQGLMDGIFLIFKVVVVIAVFALVIAFLDFAYKRWDYERRIRMSKEEIKEEYKQHEGNPLIKGAIRKRMRELRKGRMMQEVPKASVVITNPTHIAIALRYNPDLGDKAPVVLAKGKGPIAERIIEIAKLSDVPIVRKEELARAMYPVVEIGEEIPPKFYKAVAQILAFIMRRKKGYERVG